MLTVYNDELRLDMCIVKTFWLVLEDMSKDEPWFKVKALEFSVTDAASFFLSTNVITL